MTTATDGFHVLSWGPRAGQAVRDLAQSDEGRGHLRWVSLHPDAPPADRAAARAALKATRLPSMATGAFTRKKEKDRPIVRHCRAR
jgi:hypothetical protein